MKTTTSKAIAAALLVLVALTGNAARTARPALAPITAATRTAR